MKWRDKHAVQDPYDQFKLYDPFGRDCTAEGCIDQLLRLEPQGGRLLEEAERRKGRYRFVETVEPADGLKYRYMGVMRLPSSWTPAGVEAHRKSAGQDFPDLSYRFATRRTRIDRLTARYGITWDDISTREDREHWVAGGSLKVVDS